MRRKNLGEKIGKIAAHFFFPSFRRRRRRRRRQEKISLSISVRPLANFNSQPL